MGGATGEKLNWEDIERRYRGEKALLIVYGICTVDDTIGHTIAVRFDLGDHGVLMDGCHYDKVGGGIANNYTHATADLLLKYPWAVFAFFECDAQGEY